MSEMGEKRTFKESVRIGRLLSDRRNLRPFQAQAGHQPFLAEGEGVHVLRDGRGSRAHGLALIPRMVLLTVDAWSSALDWFAL